MKLYENIKRKRLELGMSQQELAHKVGYKSRSTINKIEMGINDITQSKIVDFAKALKVSPGDLMGWENEEECSLSANSKSTEKGVLIPMLAQVIAEETINGVEQIIGYEEISYTMAQQGEFFALKIKGSSMEPRMHEGDVVIALKQVDVNSGDTAIVLANGDEATVKKIVKFGGGINLVPTNNSYNVITYSNEEIRSLPVTIIGKVVELRAKY